MLYFTFIIYFCFSIKSFIYYFHKVSLDFKPKKEQQNTYKTMVIFLLLGISIRAREKINDGEGATDSTSVNKYYLTWTKKGRSIIESL